MIDNAQRVARIPKERRKLQTTRMVEWVADDLHGEPNADITRRGTLERFNSLSGQAHGLSWPGLSSPHLVRDAEHPEVLHMTQTWDPGAVGLDVSLVLMIVRRAGQAFATSRAAPAGPSTPRP